jgi:hypothetical protein
MKNKYTVLDCLAFTHYLDDSWGLSRYQFDELLIDLRKSIKNVPDCSKIIENKLSHWIRSSYTPQISSAINNFVFHEPLEEAPLHINHAILGPYAKWRLKIAK